MDQLSSLYVRMASGAHSQLHSPASVMSFVDQMQSRVEKSSAPRKSFLIDPSTPHSDVVVAESSALKPSVGWVTLQVTEGIRRGIHEWAVKIEHQGESNDESGLMLGIVPKNFSKYDTFISQGGGWCISRAGKFYGHWRRTDTGGGALTFGTGDRVVLTLDYDAAVMTVRVGEKVVVGELSGLTMEVFPAVSLHYRHQHIRFDYHAIRETSSQQLPWLQRQAFPLAPAYMPLSFDEVRSLPLDSYLFSKLFQDYISLESSSAVTMEEEEEEENCSLTAASGVARPPQEDEAAHEPSEGRHPTDIPLKAAPSDTTAAAAAAIPLTSAAGVAREKEQRAMRLYLSAEASAARLTVLSRAFTAVRRYVAVQPSTSLFLDPHVTAAYLRQRMQAAVRASTTRGSYGDSVGGATAAFSPFSNGGSNGYDAALNCGAVIVVHLFMRAVSSEGGRAVATPLVVSFRDFLLSLPLFSLVEGGAGAGSALSPDTVQLAVDHIVRLLDASTDLSAGATSTITASSPPPTSHLKKKPHNEQGDAAAVPATTAALLEVAILLALQRGLISEVLRVCRYLLRVPTGTLSHVLVEWLRRHSAGLPPHPLLPDIGRALKRTCEDPACFTPTQIDPATVVLSVAYGVGSTLYLHTADSLSKWGPSAAGPYVQLAETQQPATYCVGASRSSVAVTRTHVLLLTDRMACEEVALVQYGLALEQPQVRRWSDMHSSWPRSPRSNPQLTTMSEDCVLLLYERSGQSVAAATTASASGRDPQASVEWAEVVVHGYNAATAASLTEAPLFTRPLQPPPSTSASDIRFDHCLLLRKPSLVDLGSPEAPLTVAGGHVTVELWVQFLDKEDAATLYQHGDRSTNGEVFLELIKWEGSYCIRGGYRHDVRGSCLVSAPLPPTAERRPLHIALVFNGRWRLFLDGAEVVGNRQGPHVSLDAPKQRWTVGAGCTCLLTGLRVWRLGRSAREISRDVCRPLTGDEPGLVVQLLCNERSGNVVLNYVCHAKASHAVCSGGFAHVTCDAHPWRSGGSTAVVACPEVVGTPVCASLHEWRDLTITTCCVTRRTLLLSTPVSEDGPYSAKEGGGRAILFFDLSSGVAHRSLFFLTNRSPVRHWMRADPAGRLWEVFEVDANLVKGEQEASYLQSLLNPTGATTTAPPRPRERVLAVVPLPLEEEEGAERLCTLADSDDYVSPLPTEKAYDAAAAAAAFASADSENNNSTEVCASGQQRDETLSPLPSFAALIAQEQQQQPQSSITAAPPAATVSYATVALWLLRLLAAHADADASVDHSLFTPLADDVSSRCVAEVSAILGEHLRVVKANNARRAVALRSAQSWMVVAATLRVLLRLIRRVRAFGLHPGPLGLTVARDGSGGTGTAEAGMAEQRGTTEAPPTSLHAATSSEVTMSLLLRELHASSMRRRSGPSLLRARPSATAAAAAEPTPSSSSTTSTNSTVAGTAVGGVSADGGDGTDSSTLLGLLADVINEDGLTLSPVVVALARTVTVEGVGLFLPDVRQRARLLRDLLHATTTTSSSSPASILAPRSHSIGSSTRRAVDDGAEERVPAMNVLLDAVAQSFTTVLAAAPLLRVEDGVASLSDVCQTLCTLLEESAAQWRRRWSSFSSSSSVSAAAAATAAAGTSTAARSSGSSFRMFAASLSEAIASLQLLLLSACQGSRWEVALTQMQANAGDASATAGRSGTGGLAAGGAVASGSVGESAGGNTSSSSGNGSNGGNGGGGMLSGMASLRGALSADVWNLQHLCFSQAASYHPCVRLYYSALFSSAASCLSLCMQWSQEEQPPPEKQALTPSMMVASLGSTFLTAPLHTALNAIPLVLTVEDGEWFLSELDQLSQLTETLLDTVAAASLADPCVSTAADQSDAHMEDGAMRADGLQTSATAARRLLLSLRESLVYASAWVAAFFFNCSAVSSASVKEEAVRQRLGLASVTATPTAHRTATNLIATLDGALGQEAAVPSSPSQRGTPVDEEVAAVWEHPLLEGGIWPSDTPSAEGAAATTTTSTAGKTPATSVAKKRYSSLLRRDVFMAQFTRNAAYWSAKQAAFDPLASKTSGAMAPLITKMAAAALHLSSLPLQSLPTAQLEKLMCEVMRQLLRPVRTELMSRREGENSAQDASNTSNSDGSGNGGGNEALTTPLSTPTSTPASRRRALDATLRELQQRCEVLLRVRTCSELWRVEDVLFALPTSEAADTEFAETASTPARDSTKRRLREAWHVYKLRHMRYRAHIASRPSCTLHEATQLVKRVILSRHVTAAALLAALRQRERLATLRETGVDHLFRLMQRTPCSAECVAQLLSAQGRGAQSHFEGGVQGCGCGSVERIRHMWYELFRFSMAADGAAVGPRLSLASSASVMCGLLDRAWQPRDFAFFVQQQVVPTLIERYVTLFVPRKDAVTTSSSSNGGMDHRQSTTQPNSGLGGAGGRRLSQPQPQQQVADGKTGVKREGDPHHVSFASSPARACSVELRPVALAERRHRDHVVSAQQARRSSKSALVSAAAVLQRHSTTGEGGPRGSVLHRSGHNGSSGTESGPLQHTAAEAMQAKVWVTVKALLLQCTAMLTRRRLQTLSRVEQAAVMAFLADALKALGAELRRCCVALAYAVVDTPVLLAQAGDAAVLEPLVTVQDQVDLLCSVFSVVAGTLSNTGADSADVTAWKDDAVEAQGGQGEAMVGDAAATWEKKKDETMFLSEPLSVVCAGIAETLLELVFLDLYHAHIVRRESGVGCVVRDAAACARIAGLLLCRCQPAAVRHFATTDTTAAAPAFSAPGWRDMYASPVFSAVPLAASSMMEGGHTCLQRWLDLSTYAVATTGLSRTTQHVLLALRRLLQQPAWALELRCFAAAYKRLVLTYAKSIQRGGSGVGDGKDAWQSGNAGNSNNESSNAAAQNAATRVRELSAVQLFVWVTVLGGQLLAPPVDLGMQVSYLDDKDGFQPTSAYVVDMESVASSPSTGGSGATTSTSATAPPPSPSTSAATYRRVRGSSHALSKVAAAVAADGEHVRNVVVVPIATSATDSSGSRNRDEEVSLSPHQLLLTSWDDAITAPPYAALVDEFLSPTIEHCVPLLTEKLEPAAAFTATELSVFVALLHLTAGVMRARPDLARRLIESGALHRIRQHALLGVVRLPFPLIALKEWAALVTVRAAEEVAEHLYTGVDGRGGEEKSGGPDEGEKEEAATAKTARSGTSSQTSPASPATLRRTPPAFANDTAANPRSDGVSSSRPPYTSVPAPLARLHNSGEALLESFRSGGLSASTPTFFSGGGYVVGSTSAPSNVASVGARVIAPTGLTRDITNDYGVLRMARSFGVFAGTSTSLSGALGGMRSPPGTVTNPNPNNINNSNSNANNNNNNSGVGSSTPTPARVPPRTELSASGMEPMFLAFPMWDAHPSPDGGAASGGGVGASYVHTPAAVTITPARPEKRFPVWDDGFAIEVAVILDDGDVYPAIGDPLTIPCSWARVSASDYEEDSLPPASPSPFEFPLVTLYAADPASASVDPRLFPFIQLKVHRSCLSVTVTFPCGGGSGHGIPETVLVTKPMRREDWHHCMHVSFMCNAACVTLCRNGEAANAELRGDVGRRLETLLRQDNFIRAVVLGRPAASASVSLASLTEGSDGATSRSGNGSTHYQQQQHTREVDGPMALLGGLRIWGTSVLRTSVRVVAELVARDHALQPFGLPEHLCFFEMKEGGGGVIHSADTAQQYSGVLTGAVRWSTEPLPLGFYPSIELNAGRTRSGVAVAPLSSTRVPRCVMQTLVQSLSPFYFARFGEDVMWSLLSMAARHATITALEVGMSPAYTLQTPSSIHPTARSTLFDPRDVLDGSQKLPFQLFRLFQLQDSGCLPNRYVQLIEKVVLRLVTMLAAEDERENGGSEGREGRVDGGRAHDDDDDDGAAAAASPKKLVTGTASAVHGEGVKSHSRASLNGTKASTAAARASAVAVAAPPGSTGVTALSSLAAFVSDTALLLRQLRRDDGEMFVMELPPPSVDNAASASANASSSSSPMPLGSAVFPLAVTNGGTGMLLFDTKYRNMEQATLYKDEELKNILAKYPDGQGGWPAYALSAAEAPWAYLRSIPSSAGQRLAMDSKASGAAGLTSSILTVTVKSLKPVILHAVVRALCEALRTLANQEDKRKLHRQQPQQRFRGSTRRRRSSECENNNNGSAAGVSAARAAASCLLVARVIASLIQQSSARSSDDDCVHFVLILTDLLQLWRCMPEVSRHDQLPLAMAMSHLNFPLCSIVQHLSSDADLGSLVSATTGTYSPYVQALVGLWACAIQVDCAWAGRSYLEQLQARWQRLLRTWRRSAVHPPSGLLAPPLLPPLSSPTTTAAQQQPGLRKTTDAASRRPTPQLSTPPPSSPEARTTALSSDIAHTRAQLRATAAAAAAATVVVASEGVPVASNETAGEGQRQQLEPAQQDDGLDRRAPCVISLVELQLPEPRQQQPSTSSPLSPFRPLSAGDEGKANNNSQLWPTSRVTPYPKGVFRKGNGLWVVKGGGSSSSSNSASAAAEAGQDDQTRSGGSGGNGGSAAATAATTVRSSVGFTTGAVYWEIYVTNISRSEHSPSPASGATLAANVLVGVVTACCAPTFTTAGPDGAGIFLGNDAESWAFDGGRALRYYKGYRLESSPRTKWKMDDVIGFVLDISRNRLCCLHNGRLVSEFNGSFLSPQQRAEGVALFPVIICTGQGSCEVNFGATGFASAPPPGCLPVDPSLYISEETARVWQLVLAEEVLRQGPPAENVGSQERSQERRPVLAHPVLPLICRCVSRYARGRFGPLDVTLLCPDGNAKTVGPRECKTEKEASLLLGSVAVTAGRWYFEVVVPGEPAFHVGWYAWKALDEQGTGAGAAHLNTLNANTPLATVLSAPNARPQLGHDAFSWSLDAARMSARHHQRQTSLARHGWKCGDVVGCLLDCDAGTITYTVNGEVLKEAHGGGGGGSSSSSTDAITTATTTATTAAEAEVGAVAASSTSVDNNGVASSRSSVPTPPPPQQQSERRPVTSSRQEGASVGQQSNASALFTGISLRETRGLVPAVLLEPKSSLVCLWNDEELLFPPSDGNFRALGGAQVVRRALVEVVTETPTSTAADRKKKKSHTSASHGLNAAALQKLLYYASKVQELHPASLRSYIMPALFDVSPASPLSSSAAAALADTDNVKDESQSSSPPPRSRKPSSPQQPQQHQQMLLRDLCSVSGLDALQLRTHLAALLFFAHLSSFLYPFAYAASLPFTVEDAPLGSCWAVTALYPTLRACRAVAPPWTALRVLQRALDASNGAGDAVRLSLNRRRALTVVRDPAASIARRLRDSLFGQVYQLLSTKTATLFATNKKMWVVAFYGEGADDVGGPYRECLTQMCAELMSASLTLFVPSANVVSELGEVRDGFIVNPVCTPPVELPMYRFLGRLMGGCLRGGEPLSLYLPSALWKYLLGEAADDTDLARVDVATLNSLKYVERVVRGGDAVEGEEETGLEGRSELIEAEVEQRNAELAELCPGGFSLLNDAGVVEELVPGGACIAVTVRNASLYVQLARERKLYGSGAAQRRALQQGFHEVVPLSSVAGLKWYELEELVCGQCDYDPDALLDAARFEGLEPTDTRIVYLREVLRGFTRHQRALFMRFVSGRERLPPGIHLKIMPDDVVRSGAAPPPLTPRVSPSPTTATTTATAVMAPQPPPPPPPQTGSDGANNNNNNGISTDSGSGRSGAFIRHGALQQQQQQQQSQPPSPPQLGFTSPPRLTRTVPPPPVLQPRQLMSGQNSGATAITDTATSPSSASPAHHTVPSPPPQPQQQQQQHQRRRGNPPPEENPVLCDDTRLPHASTCFYWLRLPRYSSAAVMAEKLLFAIEQCIDIDADFRVHDTDVAEQEAGPTLARVSSDEDNLFENFSHLR